ncbi:uncharacterized protein TNCV_2427951 [Trichonephila clavipes]|nr:uncharacterized protein TNCV_2427951 [Trichonephila clavipes]
MLIHPSENARISLMVDVSDNGIGAVLQQLDHSKQKPFIFKDLKDCSHVFVRTDIVRRSLQPPYHGPYNVINRSDKVFTVFIKGKNVNVSIDRSKPCFSYNSSESDIESSIGEDTPNKPVEIPEKKIRFALLPLPTSTRQDKNRNNKNC